MANKGSTLNAQGTLAKDDFLLSLSGQFQAILQQDGNFVVYDMWNGRTPIWASDTNGRAVSVAVLQTDGNFVIYGFPDAVWATGTDGKGNCFMTMQDDGNLVIYEIAAPVWAS